jgi:hypothetical protein
MPAEDNEVIKAGEDKQRRSKTGQSHFCRHPSKKENIPQDDDPRDRET